MDMLRSQILATFVCMYVRLHMQIYLPFVHFCMHFGCAQVKARWKLGQKFLHQEKAKTITKNNNFEYIQI